jgi:tetratricopeptide (TPR) repeat protein
VLALAALWAAAVGRAADDGKEKELSPAEQAALSKEAADLFDKAGELYGAGKYDESTRLLEKALTLRERLYPEGRYPDGHPELAQNLTALGFLRAAQGEDAKALPYYERALAMRQKLYGRYKDGHPELASSLSDLGALLSKLARIAHRYRPDRRNQCYGRGLLPWHTVR